MLENLELQKELSFEELTHFFEMTAEYTVKKHETMESTYVLSLEVTDVVKLVNDEIVTESVFLTTNIYKPTMQRLIRNIGSLGYRKHCEIDSKLD
jgi:hypothetical protein